MAVEDSELGARIEAALYASGRPLSAEELAKAAGITSKRKAVKVARWVAELVNSRLHAIEVVEMEGRRFAMQLRPSYLRIARRFATKPLVPYSVLKTLSYVVYFQPVSSVDLAAKRGPQAYQHLRLLEELGFVEREEQGRTRVYRTTPIFSDYFGLSHDPKLMKEQLARLGMRTPRA